MFLPCGRLLSMHGADPGVGEQSISYVICGFPAKGSEELGAGRISQRRRPRCLLEGVLF